MCKQARFYITPVVYTYVCIYIYIMKMILQYLLFYFLFTLLYHGYIWHVAIYRL